MITTHDGLVLAVDRIGSGSVSALFVHANGFSKEMWRPVVNRLEDIEAVVLDQRGHGDSEVGVPPFDWWDNGRDLLAVVDGSGLESPRIGVGHSSGAAHLAMSEILRPGTWDALVLIEQISPPPPFGRAEEHPLVTGALRRRRSFASRDEAFESYRGRGPFARWEDDSLDLYVDHAFRRGADGAWTLACAPEVEAEYYRTATAHGAWDRLGEIACPVTMVVGEESDTHSPPNAAALAARFRDVEVITVAGATHFVPMEFPGRVAEVVQAVADGVRDGYLITRT